MATIVYDPNDPQPVATGDEVRLSPFICLTCGQPIWGEHPHNAACPGPVPTARPVNPNTGEPLLIGLSYFNPVKQPGSIEITNMQTGVRSVPNRWVHLRIANGIQHSVEHFDPEWLTDYSRTIYLLMTSGI